MRKNSAKSSSGSNLLPLFPPFVDILGSPWQIEIHKYGDDSYFKKRGCDGYCSEPDQKIVVCDVTTWPSYNGESEEFVRNSMKRVLRHEIVHAFFAESGLSDSSAVCSDGWAINEEMVDWIARQGPKIFKAWQDADCFTPITPERYLEWKAGTET